MENTNGGSLTQQSHTLFPLPIYGNTFDKEDFKLRCDKVKQKRREWKRKNKLLTK